MNCNELNKEIKTLKTIHEELLLKIDQATETGQGKVAVNEDIKSITALSDKILEKYLPDFVEKNPELLEIKLGWRIERIKDYNGNETNINSIVTLRDGSLMIGGWDGALYHANIPKPNLDTLKQHLGDIAKKRESSL